MTCWCFIFTYPPHSETTFSTLTIQILCPCRMQKCYPTFCWPIQSDHTELGDHFYFLHLEHRQRTFC